MLCFCVPNRNGDLVAVVVSGEENSGAESWLEQNSGDSALVDDCRWEGDTGSFETGVRGE